jgi:hypothetical protein
MQTLRVLMLSGVIGLTATPLLACDGADKSAARAQALADADTDGNGALSREEFQAFQDAMHRQLAQGRFDRLDADGDGQVTADELQHARPKRGPRATN